VFLASPPSEACRTGDVTRQADEPSLQGMSVLIVDDGDTNRKLLKLMLTRAGVEIDSATNGQEALTCMADRSFDAVLMDMQMPVMDGYTATREIRARGLATPIIALTAHAMAGEEERCRAAGCDGYLTKPVSREELLRTLARLQDSRTAEPRAKSHSPADSIRSTLNSEDAELRAIVDEFAAALPDYIGAIDAAWAVREWSALRDQAHAFTGTAAMTGFPQLSTAAADLERAAASQDATQVPQLLTAIESLVDRILAS
jgi:CheY-like chemotaxis protein